MNRDGGENRLISGYFFKKENLVLTFTDERIELAKNEKKELLGCTSGRTHPVNLLKMVCFFKILMLPPPLSQTEE